MAVKVPYKSQQKPQRPAPPKTIRLSKDYLMCFNIHCVYQKVRFCKYSGRMPMYIDEYGKCNICKEEAKDETTVN